MARRPPAPPAPPAARAAALEARVDEVRRAGRSRRFDCVVGMSGGRDSTYLLHRLVTKHGLRCLAAYYRTPFTSDVTDANVRRACAALGVALVPIGISTEEHLRVAREMLELWLDRPGDGTVAHMMCAPCKLVNRELFRIARAQGVRTVISGSNRYEAVQIAVGIGDGDAVPGRARLRLGADLRRTFTMVERGIEALARSRSLLRHLRLGVQASVLYLNPHTPFLRARYPEIRSLNYFYYADWTQEDCERALAELAWQLPPGCNSTWKADCCFAEVKNVVFERMTGMTYLDAFLGNMVREGAIGRPEALRRAAVEGVTSTERLRAACDVLGIPVDRLLAKAGGREPAAGGVPRA